MGYKNNIITLKANKSIPVNSLVYRTYSKDIDDKVSSIIKNKLRKVKVKFIINVIKNKKIEFIVNDYQHEIKILGNVPEISINKSITESDIKEKIEKINNTIYEIDDLKINLDKDLFVPISHINNLKREIIDKLDEVRINSFNKQFKECEYYIEVNDYKRVNEYTLYTNNKTKISDKYKYIYSDNLNNTITKIPKVINNYLKFDINREYLVGEIGSLNKLKNIITDYSFNVVNSYTVAFLHSIGVKRVTLSLELIDSDIVDLVNNYIKRYKKRPNLELIKKTNIEVMVIKTDLFKYGNVYYLRDRFNNKYRVIKKNNMCYIYDYKETKRENSDEFYFNLGINYLRDEYFE